MQVKKGLVVLLVIMALVLNCVTFAAQSAKITSIPSISASVNQNDKYVLPTKVKAIYSDKSMKDVPVKWNTGIAKTDKAGIFTYTGAVQGFKGNVSLKLTVRAVPTIKSIQNLTSQIYCGDKFVLPGTITAKMSDNTDKKSPVAWNVKNVDTSKAGTFTFEGTVAGYSKKVLYNLTIQLAVKSIENQTNKIICNESFTLPSHVAAIMSDESEKKLPVKWNASDINTSRPGVFKFEGSVDGYKSKVLYTLTIIEPVKINSVQTEYVTIKVGDQLTIPQYVNAYMSDGTVAKAPVRWTNTNVINVNKADTYRIEGIVDNFVGKAELVIQIEKYTVQEIARNSNKVVLINIYDNQNKLVSTGSGFIISTDGMVATNYHVIAYAERIEAVTHDNKKYQVEHIVSYDKHKDIAIIMLDSTGVFPTVKLGDSDKLELGQEIVAIGSPLGLQNTVSTGVISSIRPNMYRQAPGSKDIQISAPISPGSSGGRCSICMGK